MDFRNKLKSYISRIPHWGRNQWKKEVQSEKKQKYLFGGMNSDDGFKRSRNTSTIATKAKKIVAYSHFFQEKIITKDIFKTYGYIMSVIGLVLIFLTVYIVVFSPYFKISPNQVIVEATTPGIDIAIAYRVLESTYGESIFTIDEADIAKKLKLQLKNISSITIDSLYPNGIKVLLTGAPILFDTTITGIPSKKWGISQNGILVPEDDLKDMKPKYHLNINSPNLVGDFFLNYRQGISDNNISIILRILAVFENEWSDFKLGRSQYFSGENELHIVLESGTKVIFAMQNDTDPQSGDLPRYILDQLITLRTYIANNRNRFTDGSLYYVDARISGKLFICADKTVCQKNLILIYGDAYK